MSKLRHQSVKLIIYCLLFGNNLSWAEKKDQVEKEITSTNKPAVVLPKTTASISKSSIANDSIGESTEDSAVNIPSLNAQQANWVFSGIVSNENGEYYSYFFKMQRQGKDFNTLAALINDQTKQVIFLEENKAKLENSEENHWRVGNTFLKFNNINNSWIFGARGKNKAGFNFKVDMQSRVSDPIRKKPSELRPGVSFLINQTGHLNGHIQLGEIKETKNKDLGDQFVTAHTAWFRQIWLTKAQDSLHPFQGIFCQFNEGNGFYSLNLAEEDALIGAIAGWRNEQGKPVRMSQFVVANEMKSGEWRIDISTPKVQLLFENALANEEKKQLIMGAVENKPGFCVINQDEIG